MAYKDGPQEESSGSDTESVSSYIAHQQEPPPEFHDVEPAKPTETKVSYMSLANKKQLAILCVARLADPLAASSIQVRIHPTFAKGSMLILNRHTCSIN